MALLPKDKIFFDLFINSANKVFESAVSLKQIVEDTTDIENKVKKVKEIEEECDQNTHDIFTQLNKAFVTPLDREDIYQIAKELDEIVDFVEEAAYLFVVFNVKEARSEALILVELIIKAAEEIKGIMANLKNKKDSKELSQRIIEINRIENEGDSIYRQAIKKLFSDKIETLEVVKWKEIFDFLENALDACEHLANTVEGVVMKHA